MAKCHTSLQGHSQEHVSLSIFVFFSFFPMSVWWCLFFAVEACSSHFLVAFQWQNSSEVPQMYSVDLISLIVWSEEWGRTVYLGDQ